MSSITNSDSMCFRLVFMWIVFMGFYYIVYLWSYDFFVPVTGVLSISIHLQLTNFYSSFIDVFCVLFVSSIVFPVVCIYVITVIIFTVGIPLGNVIIFFFTILCHAVCCIWVSCIWQASIKRNCRYAHIIPFILNYFLCIWNVFQWSIVLLLWVTMHVVTC